MQPDPNDTPFPSEFQGIEAMLNSSDAVDWVSLQTPLFSSLCMLTGFVGHVGIPCSHARRLLEL
jgi:hypothetical protein